MPSPTMQTAPTTASTHWSNPRRWDRGPIRDRIANAKDRFPWWLIGKWLGFAGGVAAVLFPWLFFLHRALAQTASFRQRRMPGEQTAIAATITKTTTKARPIT